MGARDHLGKTVTTRLRTIIIAVLACFALAPRIPAQHEGDFLTPDEVDQIRDAQDPNDRLQVYIHFAKQRLDQINQLLSKEKPGRSVLIHNLLDEYGKIIDAMDTVTDDALKRKLDVSTGVGALQQSERDMLDQLKKFESLHPKDEERYQFALKQDIDATSDSLELSSEDLGRRSKEVQAAEQKEQERREALMRPEEVEEKKTAEKKEAAKKRKAPSLYQKGEKPEPTDTSHDSQ